MSALEFQDLDKPLSALALEQTEEKEEKLDVEASMHALVQAFDHVERMRGKEVVLILGNTGAGKSTLVNYLMGCTLEQKEHEETGEPYVQTVETPYAAIGHAHEDADSKTENIEFYQDPQLAWGYCDSPGFLDNRGWEARIRTALGQQCLTQVAKAIKAIVLVIPVTALTDQRGENLRSLLSILSHFLPDPEACTASLFFVFTKVGTKKKEHILTLLSKLGTLPKGRALNQQDYELHTMVQLILSQPEHLLLFQPLDQGMLRWTLQQAFSEAKSIPPEQFKLGVDPETAHRMETVLGETTFKAFEALNLVHSLPIRLQKLHKQQARKVKAVETIQTRLKEQKESMLQQDFVKQIAQLKATHEEESKRLRAALLEEQAQLEKVSYRLKELQEGKPIKYFDESFFTFGKSYLRRQGLFSRKFVYQGPPIHEVKAKVNFGGELVVEKETQNYYKAIHYYDPSRKARAQVRVYILPRYHPTHKLEICTLQKQVSEHTSRLSSMKAQLESTLKHQTHLEQEKVALGEMQLAVAKEKLTLLQEEWNALLLERTEERMALDQTIAHVQTELDSAQTYVTQRHTLFKKLEKIARTITFESPLKERMEDFLSAWRLYQLHRTPSTSSYSGTFFSGSSTSSTAFSVQNEEQKAFSYSVGSALSSFSSSSNSNLISKKDEQDKSVMKEVYSRTKKRSSGPLSARPFSILPPPDHYDFDIPDDQGGWGDEPGLTSGKLFSFTSSSSSSSS